MCLYSTQLLTISTFLNMNRRILLLAGLLSLGATAKAQWATQPIAFPNAFSTPYFIKGVDANTVWTIGYDLDAGSGTNYARSTNGGVTWTAGTVTGVTATTGIVTSLTAADANTAWVTVLGANGSRIMKTSNGGTTWTQQGTAFSSPDSYPNMIHFFNANEGVAQGDPLTDGGSFEMYRTTDGGTTWTPVTTPASLSGEYGAEAQPAAAGNNIWFGTLDGRVYHSTDKGATWTVADAALPDGVFALAFRDAQNGLANSLDLDTGAKLLKRTTDGGATWSSVTYTGLFPGFGLDNVPGTQQYIATGFDLAGTGNATGSSYSRDNGQTWVTLETAISHTRVDAVSPTAIWSGAIDDNTFGGLGMNRLTTTTLGTKPVAAEQLGFSVYPNPSADGRFVVGSKVARTGVELRVSDALGREVTRRTWQCSTATPFTLDLSQYKAGVYSLEILSEAGTSHQKLVVR